MKKTRIIQLCFLLFAVAFAGCKGKSGSEQAGGAFTPGELWPDNNGVHINAHGGGILHDGWWEFIVTLPKIYITGKTKALPYRL